MVGLTDDYVRFAQEPVRPIKANFLLVRSNAI